MRDLVAMRRAVPDGAGWLEQQCGLADGAVRGAIVGRVDAFMKAEKLECRAEKHELLAEMRAEFARLLIVLLGVSFRELQRSTNRVGAEGGPARRLPSPAWAARLLEPAEAEAIFGGGASVRTRPMSSFVPSLTCAGCIV